MNTWMKLISLLNAEGSVHSFAMFLSLFALDVFGEGGGFWETARALVLHLVPVYIVVIALVVAWRWEWVGAVLFNALALLYVAMMWGRFPLATYLCISGPLVFVGDLFLFNWIYKAQLRTRPSPPDLKG